MAIPDRFMVIQRQFQKALRSNSVDEIDQIPLEEFHYRTLFFY